MNLHFSAFADEGHSEGTPHGEAVSIDPLLLIIIIVIIAVVGFVVWKFVLKGESTTDKK